jgi:hypothetical protein
MIGNGEMGITQSAFNEHLHDAYHKLSNNPDRDISEMVKGVWVT